MVVCTRHPGYRKEHNKLMPLAQTEVQEYPELVKLPDERHIQYNRMLDKIAYLERGQDPCYPPGQRHQCQTG